MTLLSIVRERAREKPEQRIFTWVNSSCKERDSLTCGSLWQRAGAVANLLESKGIKRGDCVLVAYPPGLSFLAGFVGCLRAGVIPCSVYPPNPKQLSTDLPKLDRVARDAGAEIVLTTGVFKKGLKVAAKLARLGRGNLTWLATDALDVSNQRTRNDVAARLADPAFVQYTSGSTGDPKGVIISHRSLVGNARKITHDTGAAPGTVGVFWVPQYHDMVRLHALVQTQLHL